MEANDPDAPTTTRKFFNYPTLTGGKVRGSVVIDPGSIKLVPDPRTGAARDMEPPRRHASNWQQVAASRSATGRPLGVMGPQLGYYYPEIVYQEQLQGPGINAQGVSVSGLGPVPADRAHARLRLEPHHGDRRQRGRVRREAVRARRWTSDPGDANATCSAGSAGR